PAPTGPSYRTHRPNRPHRTLPLRGYAIQHPRVRNGFAEVFEAADPGHHAFDAHPEASVRDAAEATQIEVPLERFAGQVMRLDPRQQQVIVVDALPAPDDLAVPFGCEDVDRQRDVGTIG